MTTIIKVHSGKSELVATYATSSKRALVTFINEAKKVYRNQEWDASNYLENIRKVDGRWMFKTQDDVIYYAEEEEDED